MTEKRYFPAIHIQKKADRYEAVCGFKLVSLLKASLLANENQAAQATTWQNPLHPFNLHNSRVGFLKAVSEWPENAVLALHISANPNLVLIPKGKTSIAISLHSIGETKNLASEAVLSHFLQMRGLLPIYFPEAEFTPITDFEELQQRITPFSPTRALSITRRRETLSLAKPFDEKTIGFGSSLSADKNPDHSAVHLFPWTPSFSNWHKLIKFLLRQIDPLWLMIRVRPGKLTLADQSRLSGTIEACEAFLNKTRVSKNVFTKMAEMLRDFSLERLVELHNIALNVGVFMLARHAIDPSEASILGQAITEGYNRDEKQGLLKGGFLVDSIEIDKAVDCEFFAEIESFTSHEAACAFRLPTPPPGHLPGVPIKSSRTAFIQLPRAYSDQSNLIKLGVNQHQGTEQPVVIGSRDRMRHCFIMGQTGTGKSTLLESMILQDIRAGQGLCLLDPHGELVESILGKIPKERNGDVILFDPMDRERPVGFNLIEWNTIEERDFIIDELYLTLDRIYDMRQTGGPIFESNFRGMMKLLMGDQEREGFVPTALEFPILYLDTNFREWLRGTTKDSQVHDFVRELERTGGDASLNNLAPYITSKFSRFVNDIRLRRIIGQERTPFDFRDIMDEGKILLMNLGKGRFGEVVSGLLAGLVVSRFKAAAMSRADQSYTERREFYLYVDEFHNLPKENFGELLSEARKYNLGLVLATQYTDQLKGASGYDRDDLLPAVLGNVGTLIMFRLGIKDAEKIAPAFYPVFNHKDLINLANFRAYARFQVMGSFLPAFSFLTQKEKTPHNEELASRLRTLSRLKYGLGAEIVDAQIAKRRDFWKDG